jgi:LemA protein
MSLGLLVLLILIGVVGFVILIYNGLVRKRMAVRNMWSNISTQLQRRYDLIPNLVETVKGYAAHEKEIFENVAKLRSSFQSTQSVKEMGQIEGAMQSVLGRLFAVAENYPDLKANQNFKLLQEELVGTENKVAYSRQGYNNSVMAYNAAILTFPAVIFAGMFGFRAEEFFEVESEEVRKAPKVSF